MVRAVGYAIEHRRAHTRRVERAQQKAERFNANATPRGCRRREAAFCTAAGAPEVPRAAERSTQRKSHLSILPRVTAPPRRQQIVSRVKPKPLYG